MKKLSDKAVKVLTVLINIVEEHVGNERVGVNIHTDDFNARVGGSPKVPFRDEAVLCECAEWCEENALPLLTMMLSADKDGIVYDQFSCKLIFKHGVNLGASKVKETWKAERKEIAALGAEDVSRAKETLEEAVRSLNVSKAPSSRRALANARNQEVDAKSLDEWLARYQDVLDVMSPGQPLIHNDFMDSQEGYKERAWECWHKTLAFDEWAEDSAGSGAIASKLQTTFDDNAANWITKRYGGFDLAAKLSEKPHGTEDFFEKAVALLGRQYPVVSHQMFLKDKDAYIPVKPDAFETGLRKLGVEFYLSGFCSWDNYTRFLGYLEHILQMLLEIDSETTLLDAHSILWIIGSGYWFEGEGSKTVALMHGDEQAASGSFESRGDMIARQEPTD